MLEQAENINEIDIDPIENIVRKGESGLFTTSLIVAQAFEKEHKNVLRDIENLECSPEFHQLNFEHTPYVHPQNGQTYPAYRLTRDGFAFLAMGFTGKKAALWKEKFLEAFNAMERALRREQVGQESESRTPQAIPAKPPRKEPVHMATKLTSGQKEAIRGLIRMVAYVEQAHEEDILEQLLVSMQVQRLEAIKKHAFSDAFLFLWRKIFYFGGPEPVSGKCAKTLEDGIAAIEGLLDLWGYISVNYDRQSVNNILCNFCNIPGLSAITTKERLDKAVLAAFTCLISQTLYPGPLRDL